MRDRFHQRTGHTKSAPQDRFLASNKPNPDEYYIGRRIQLNANPNAVKYAGYPAGTAGEIADVKYDSDDDYCIGVLLGGFSHIEWVKKSHVTLMPKQEAHLTARHDNI